MQQWTELFGPIEKLARKPSPIKRTSRSKTGSEDVPAWMKVFFRGLGILLLVLAGVLLAPVIRPVDQAPPPDLEEDGRRERVPG